MDNPKPEEIVALRNATGMSQTEFAEMIHKPMRTLQNWEGGINEMPVSIWDLALIKAEEHIRASQHVDVWFKADW